MEARITAQRVLDNMKRVIIGKDQVLEKVLVCLFARGHLLIEDVPGVGKTTMVKALSKSLKLEYSRVQFTPDLMPSDIIGVTIYSRGEEKFVFKKGPVFNQIILADEINRTSPKTQASLLQAMEEGEVSVEETTYTLKKPFMVLATQNPIEYQGTFPLPEAQLDRFLMCITLGYPDIKEEKEIIRNYKNSKSLENIRSVATEEEILKIQEAVDEIFLHEDLLHYIVNIVTVSRNHHDIQLGGSPRASIDLYRSSKALAFIRGRAYVIPDDIKELAPFVLNHRLILSAEARIEGKRIDKVIQDILRKVYVPVVNTLEK